jgi:integrase
MCLPCGLRGSACIQSRKRRCPHARRGKLALVFPGGRGTPFSGWSKAKSALDTASGVSGWWLHDLRRTLATGLQRLGVRLEVTEAVLNHLSGSRGGVVGIYQRHDWAEEKRAAVCAPSRRGGRQAACRKGVAHLD